MDQRWNDRGALDPVIPLIACGVRSAIALDQARLKPNGKSSQLDVLFELIANDFGSFELLVISGMKRDLTVWGSEARVGLEINNETSL